DRVAAMRIRPSSARTGLNRMAAANCLPITLLTVLAGCGDGAQRGPDAGGAALSKAAEAAPARPEAVPAGQVIGTPNEDRVATLALLNKRNNLTQDLVM